MKRNNEELGRLRCFKLWLENLKKHIADEDSEELEYKNDDPYYEL